MPNDMVKRVENNHDELNLEQILFLLLTEIKNKIRKLEKAYNVFINNEYGIIFNETYIGRIVSFCEHTVVNLYQFGYTYYFRYKIVWNSCLVVIWGQFMPPRKIIKI